MIYIPLINHSRGTLAEIQKSMHDGCRRLKKVHRQICRHWSKLCNFLKCVLNKYISLCYFLQGEKRVYQNVHGVRESMVSKLECID